MTTSYANAWLPTFKADVVTAPRSGLSSSPKYTVKFTAGLYINKTLIWKTERDVTYASWDHDQFQMWATDAEANAMFALGQAMDHNQYEE